MVVEKLSNDIDTKAYLKKIGVDLDKPYDSVIKKTRVAFSDRRISESIQDGYRHMSILNKQDFQTNYGGIMRIEELFGSMEDEHEEENF